MAVKFQGGKAVPVNSEIPQWANPKDWNQLLDRGKSEVRQGKVPLLDARFKNAVFAAGGDLATIIQMMEAKAITPKARAAVAKLRAMDNGLSGKIYEIVSSGFVWD